MKAHYYGDRQMSKERECKGTDRNLLVEYLLVQVVDDLLF
jgi:hypothetical protein